MQFLWYDYCRPMLEVKIIIGVNITLWNGDLFGKELSYFLKISFMSFPNDLKMSMKINIFFGFVAEKMNTFFFHIQLSFLSLTYPESISESKESCQVWKQMP